ncbi:MAG: SDR family NAD(P)-dependent oxidoreductase [Microcystis viridis Mv_BB_P_19951000_S69]|uniref:SDR family NAD(P)-dependent oxidoreductase n=1 Tax=Microcystis viridis Mv_BB_P_19951000_S68D TaxID=2486270 RepID=A0A552H909_MICVR|nr:MAG: SDR family NAD(P)-dependent oxidoreductase [Microcystis viridis Mv_BB_P_19951000_S68D]TRU75792.1 MAG: SDR family NAD(P)-dependent oxidoreductase [Microcystis viridis Mv_BB_P_19951000_S68]TRU77621.1 MAG: SDR family NAD(P)-dependent oxidoreductase [Microcystis viridis Mv_BB_P_19951000_S69]TRU88532.1 MAG: SDR family NAD(P)-dependent oxidoreductase [Microcystis viridis Mv_BB_P_19951000_S69D]
MFPKVALITGCSSGFGLLTTVELLQRGFLVIATMRNLEKRDRLDKALSKLDFLANQSSLNSFQTTSQELSLKTESSPFLDTPHPFCKLFQLDVTRLDSIQVCVGNIIEYFKSIDVLVNNAGYGLGGFAEDTSLEEFRSLFETNFWGLVTLTQAVIPQMRTNGQGHIINVSSLYGLMGVPAFSAYCSSKFAVEGFSESLRYELRPFNIWVSLVEPGSYPTDIFSANMRVASNSQNLNSPYYERGQRLLNKILEDIKSTKADPQAVAKLIGKIAQTKTPKLRYMIGSESIYVTLKNLLPSFLFESLLAYFLS